MVIYKTLYVLYFSRYFGFQVLTEQVEVLKTVKADKTNMEDNLAAKADMIHVLRKVSHDHFETRMERLNNMVEDTFTRLDAHVRLNLVSDPRSQHSSQWPYFIFQLSISQTHLNTKQCFPCLLLGKGSVCSFNKIIYSCTLLSMPKPNSFSF